MLSADHRACNGQHVQVDILCKELIRVYPAAYGTSVPAVRAVIEDAIAKGLLKKKTKKGAFKVTLLDEGKRGPGQPVTYPPTNSHVVPSSIVWVLDSERARFAPLIKHMLQRGHHEAYAAHLEDLHNYFKTHQPSTFGIRKLKAFADLVGKAVEHGLLRYVGLEETSLALLRDCTYILPE